MNMLQHHIMLGVISTLFPKSLCSFFDADGNIELLYGSDKRPFQEAKLQCQKVGLQLAEVEDEEEWSEVGMMSVMIG